MGGELSQCELIGRCDPFWEFLFRKSFSQRPARTLGDAWSPERHGHPICRRHGHPNDENEIAKIHRDSYRKSFSTVKETSKANADLHEILDINRLGTPSNLGEVFGINSPPPTFGATPAFVGA